MAGIQQSPRVEDISIHARGDRQSADPSFSYSPHISWCSEKQFLIFFAGGTAVGRREELCSRAKFCLLYLRPGRVS